MPPDARLVDFATDLLDGVVTGLTNAGIDVPTHRYIHHGDFAADLTPENCGDALIVSFSGIVQGGGQTGSNASIAGTPIKCAVPLFGSFNVILLRCVPSMDEEGNPPTAEALNDVGIALMEDAMTLSVVIIDIYLGDGCNIKAFGSVVPVGPEGAVGGNIVNILTELT